MTNTDISKHSVSIGIYVLYNSNNEIELISNNKEDFTVSG